MRKQELVHLHGLLVETTTSLVESGAVSPTIWTDYEALEIDSARISAQKSDHEEAVLLLATSLGTTLDQPTDDRSAVIPNQ